MATQTQRHQPNQHVQRLLPFLLLFIGIVGFTIVGVIWNVARQQYQFRPAAPAQQYLPVGENPIVTGQVGPLTLESYELLSNPYQENECVALETYQTVFGAQESRCYNTLAIPPVSLVANTPFGLSAEQTAAVLAKADGVVYMPSHASRLGADATYFHVGQDIFYAVWVAGDCTPRIFDGSGGYWQMPTSPVFRDAENVPYGSGYLFELPQNWLTDWRRNPAQTTDWRLCAGSSFWYGGS